MSDSIVCVTSDGNYSDLHTRNGEQHTVTLQLGVIEQMMKAQASSTMQGMEMTAEEMKLSVVFNSFDKVKDVTVPDDVKQNAVEGADALDVQSLLMGGGI